MGVDHDDLMAVHTTGSALEEHLQARRPVRDLSPPSVAGVPVIPDREPGAPGPVEAQPDRRDDRAGWLAPPGDGWSGRTASRFEPALGW